MAVQALLEAARDSTGMLAGLDNTNNTQGVDGASAPAANISPEAVDEDAFDLESELSRIIDGCTSATQNNDDERPTNAVTQADSAVESGAGRSSTEGDTQCDDARRPAAVEPYSVKGRLMSRSATRTGGHATGSRTRGIRRAARPALAKSTVLPTPKRMRLGQASGHSYEATDEGLTEISYDALKRYRSDRSDSEGERQTTKRSRTARAAGTSGWRPPHLPRQRQKPVAAGMDQTAPQASGTPFTGG